MMNERFIPKFATLVAFAVTAGAAHQATALPLTVTDEGSLEFSNFKYFNKTAIIDVLNGYLICANTNWKSGSPLHQEAKVVPRNRVDGSGAAVFKFGEVNLDNSPVINDDVRSMRIGAGGTGLSLSAVSASQAPGTLGCYGLDQSGTRVIWYNGLFVDHFEAPPPKTCPSSDVTDPCVSVRVAEIRPDTTAPGTRLIYKYYVDYYLPAASATYVLRDGYDSSVINPAITQWCMVGSGVQTCDFPTVSYGNRTVDAFLVGSATAPVTGRVIVNRVTNNGVTNISTIGTPVVMAGLFPEYAMRLEESQVDNNVSIGSGSLSNFAPIIDTSATDIKGLVEGGAPVTVIFQLTDDSTESSGNLLRATASVNLNGIVSSPAVSCGSATPQPGPGASRSCSFSIALPNADFATDRLPSIYAPGVSASVAITATDPQGLSASSASLPFHVTSSDNDPPSFDLAIKGTHGDPIPVINCSLANLASTCLDAQSLTDAVARIVNQADGTKAVSGFVVAKAGALNSVDEIAAQSTSFNVDTSTGRGGNIKCVLDAGSPEIFRPSTGGPKLSPTTPSASYSLTFGLNEVNVGSATCDVSVKDAQAGGFPADQLAVSSPVQQFRIVVTN